MPKQSGIYQIKGKFEQRSYYHPKNMSTGVFRSINQQMSERVKTEPNYANTRKYAGEFGCSTSWANQTTSYLATLAPISNLTKKRGDISHTALGMIRQDTTHEFGRRSLRADGWVDSMMAMFNQLPRVPFDANFGSTMSFYSFPIQGSDPSPYKVHLNISPVTGLSEKLKTWGANRVAFDIYACRWEAGYYSTLLGSYYPTQLTTELLASYVNTSFPVVADVDTTLSLRTDIPKFWYVKILVVATPLREVNGEEFTLDHLRSFKFFDLTPSTTRFVSLMYNGITYEPDDAHITFDLSSAPTIRVNMELGIDVGLFRPTAKVNGYSASVQTLSRGSYVLTLPAFVDADVLRTITMTFGDKNFQLEVV